MTKKTTPSSDVRGMLQRQREERQLACVGQLKLVEPGQVFRDEQAHKAGWTRLLRVDAVVWDDYRMEYLVRYRVIQYDAPGREPPKRYRKVLHMVPQSLRDKTRFRQVTPPTTIQRLRHAAPRGIWEYSVQRWTNRYYLIEVRRLRTRRFGESWIVTGTQARDVVCRTVDAAVDNVRWQTRPTRRCTMCDGRGVVL